MQQVTGSTHLVDGVVEQIVDIDMGESCVLLELSNLLDVSCVHDPHKPVPTQFSGQIPEETVMGLRLEMHICVAVEVVHKHLEAVRACNLILREIRKYLLRTQAPGKWTSYERSQWPEIQRFSDCKPAIKRQNWRCSSKQLRMLKQIRLNAQSLRGLVSKLPWKSMLQFIEALHIITDIIRKQISHKVSHRGKQLNASGRQGMQQWHSK